jgi:hypothetical protein
MGARSNPEVKHVKSLGWRLLEEGREAHESGEVADDGGAEVGARLRPSLELLADERETECSFRVLGPIVDNFLKDFDRKCCCKAAIRLGHLLRLPL